MAPVVNAEGYMNKITQVRILHNGKAVIFYRADGTCRRYVYPGWYGLSLLYQYAIQQRPVKEIVFDNTHTTYYAEREK